MVSTTSYKAEDGKVQIMGLQELREMGPAGSLHKWVYMLWRTCNVRG